MANNFSGDPSVKALWRFESGALTIDSSGKGNTLTNTGVSADTSDFQEGAASANFDGSHCLYLPQSGMASDFPFKSGVGGPFSICFRFQTVAGNQTNYQKFFCNYVWPNTPGFGIAYRNDGNIYLENVYAASSYQGAALFAPAAGHWYFLCVFITPTGTFGNNTVYWYAWDLTAGTIASYGSAQVYYQVVVGSTATFSIGVHDASGSPSGYEVGHFDEVVVFNRTLSLSEIVAVNKQTYSFPVPISTNKFSSDPACKAVWAFNWPNSLNEELGNSAFNLTPMNGAAWGQYEYIDLSNPLADNSSIYFSGSYSGLLINTGLPSPASGLGFPFASGDTKKQGTFTFWAQPTANVQYAKAICRWDWSDQNITFGIQPGCSAYSCQVSVAYGSGQQNQTIDTGWKPTNGQKYHYAVAIDGQAKTVHIRVWGVTENAIVVDTTVALANDIRVDTFSQLIIGCEQYTLNNYAGRLGEVTAFNRILSSSEMDTIRQGTFVVLQTMVPAASRSTGACPSPAMQTPVCPDPCRSTTTALQPYLQWPPNTCQSATVSGSPIVAGIAAVDACRSASLSGSPGLAAQALSVNACWSVTTCRVPTMVVLALLSTPDPCRSQTVCAIARRQDTIYSDGCRSPSIIRSLGIEPYGVTIPPGSMFLVLN